METELKCDECNTVFSKIWVLRRHKKEQHSGLVFRCQHCDSFECKRQENLKTHIQNMHPDMASPTISPSLPPFNRPTDQVFARKQKPEVANSKVVRKERIVVGRVGKPLSRYPVKIPSFQSPQISSSVQELNFKPENVDDDDPQVMKLEIEILEHQKQNYVKKIPKLQITNESPPKKKLIQLEVLTKENQNTGDFNFQDESEEHSSISILDVKEIPCPLRKDVYSPSPSVLNRSRKEIQNFYTQNQLTIRRRDPPGPVLSFKEVGFPIFVVNQLESHGYEQPTAIQSATWPIALSGYNIVGIQECGSGKKLAYLLPALIHLTHQDRVEEGEGPIVLILSPTKEIGQEIKSTLDNYANLIGIRSFCSNDSQTLSRQLHKNHDKSWSLIIGTPEEIVNLLTDKIISLNRCSYLVIDKIDKIDAIDKVQEIFNESRKDIQALVWCTQLSAEIEKFVDKNLKDYVKIGHAEN